jgi:hypothetical protein
MSIELMPTNFIEVKCSFHDLLTEFVVLANQLFGGRELLGVLDSAFQDLGSC